MWWIIKLSPYNMDIDEFETEEEAEFKLEELKRVRINTETLCLVKVKKVVA